LKINLLYNIKILKIMTKKFELSAYGVEEMNQKELIGIEGGEFSANDLIDLIELVWNLITATFETAVFGIVRGSINQTGGLLVGGSADSEFWHQVIRGI
jgi:hypothetical protein